MKKYEQYVVTKILHSLPIFELKFVCQQFVKRPNGGRALTDLYFPQLKTHIEIDEGFHQNQINADRMRERDIIDITGHQLERIDASKSLEDINTQIELLVELLISKYETSKIRNEFEEWSFDLKNQTEKFIKKGHISVGSDSIFKTIVDACNCFGHNYKGMQRAGAPHPDKSTMLWFPKLFPNGKWENSISDDECTIVERPVSLEERISHFESHYYQQRNEKHRRVVFAKVKDDLGMILYRFKGLFELNLNESSPSIGLVWSRIATSVRTYKEGEI